MNFFFLSSSLLVHVMSLHFLPLVFLLCVLCVVDVVTVFINIVLWIIGAAVRALITYRQTGRSVCGARLVHWSVPPLHQVTAPLNRQRTQTSEELPRMPVFICHVIDWLGTATHSREWKRKGGKKKKREIEKKKKKCPRLGLPRLRSFESTRYAVVTRDSWLVMCEMTIKYTCNRNISWGNR